MKNKKLVLCTLCARGGSKGLKNKNFLNLNGKPLLNHSIEHALNLSFVDNVVFSTDSLKIKQLSIKAGADCWFIRDKELSSDKAAKIPVISDLLLRSEARYKKKFDYIIDLDVTSPLRVFEDTIKAFNLFLDKDAANLITGCESRKNPYFNMVEVHNELPKLVKKSNYKRRQDAPKVYDMNASIYIWKREALIKQKSLFTNKTVFYEMPFERSIDIDSKSDFDYVEFLMEDSNES